MPRIWKSSSTMILPHLKSGWANIYGRSGTSYSWMCFGISFDTLSRANSSIFACLRSSSSTGSWNVCDNIWQWRSMKHFTDVKVSVNTGRSSFRSNSLTVMERKGPRTGFDSSSGLSGLGISEPAAENSSLRNCAKVSIRPIYKFRRWCSAAWKTVLVWSCWPCINSISINGVEAPFTSVVSFPYACISGIGIVVLCLIYL